MRKLTKRSATIVAVTAIAISGGAAWAANWYLNGVNSGTATGASVQPVDVKLTAVQGLYPGGEVNARVDVRNPNPYKVKVESLGAVSVTGGSTACPSTLVTVDPASIGQGVVATPTGSGFSNFATLQKTFKLAANAPEDCVGQVFSVSFTTTGSIVTTQ